MSTFIVLLLAVLGAAGTFAWRRMQLRLVLRFGKEQGWEMLVVNSFGTGGTRNRKRLYAVRFRDQAGALVEGVIEPQMLGEFRLTKEHRIPKKVERGMFDRNVALDCRKCGATVPPGTELCPYCHSSRDILTIR